MNPEWKVVMPLDFCTFHETLARQMLAYNPKHAKYLGDDKFRACTIYSKSKRSTSPVPPPLPATITTTSAGVTKTTLVNASNKRRFCGFLDELREHWNSCTSMEENKKKACAFCGVRTYQFCGICDVAVHKYPNDKSKNGIPCFYLYHDTGCFGLARGDCKELPNKKLKEWTYPTLDEIRDNVEDMKRLSEQVNGISASSNNGSSKNNSVGNNSNSVSNSNNDDNSDSDSSNM